MKPIEIISAQPTSDGAGVKLLRVFGGNGAQRFDPFLMLDEFGSDDASDYIGGFPPHPHRGFETITYMLQGKMEHRDHMNNVGLLNDGDVQWMTAGRGIIHSEMPRQTEGRMRGFQLWLNLPAATKMQPAYYSDIAHEQLPVFELDAARVIAIAGDGECNDKTISGLLQRDHTTPCVWDIHLNDSAESLSWTLKESLNAMIYVYDGQIDIEGHSVGAQQLARLGEVTELRFAGANARVLLIAGTPLREAIAQYGPFVMNTEQEIEQAIADYRNGVLAEVAKSESVTGS